MGEGQNLSADEQLALAYEQLENTKDLTTAVEEEFALLDPTLSASTTASSSCRLWPPARRSSRTSSAS